MVLPLNLPEGAPRVTEGRFGGECYPLLFVLEIAMQVKLHKNARTTPALRKELQNSNLPERVLAKKYGLTRDTVRKWKHRQSIEDASHRPHNFKATMTREQEVITVEARKLLLLSLDDLLVLVRTFINPDVSRSGLDRCLRRHGVSNLKQLIAEQQDTQGKQKHKAFNDYRPGFIHVDIKYLPILLKQPKRQYLYLAIDRATRWVYLEVLDDNKASTAAGFLKRLCDACPVNIYIVLTDNGRQFTDRVVANGEREPTGEHPFDQLCSKQQIEHRLIKPRNPQTTCMIERFNGKISEILTTNHFNSAETLELTLMSYSRIYNYVISQRALGHKPPIDVMKQWYNSHPRFFRKPVYKLAGLDE